MNSISSAPRFRINLLTSKMPLRRASCFGRNTVGAGEMNWTRWLVEAVREEIRTSGHKPGIIAKVIQDSPLEKTKFINSLANELRESLKKISEKTLANPDQAEDIVKDAAKDFIELANLSPKGDSEFVRFILDVILRAEAMHFPDNLIHYGVVTFYFAAVMKEMAEEMGYSEREMDWGRTAAVIHDIKQGVDSALLDKQKAALLDIQLIDQHLFITVYLLKQIKWLKNVVKIIRHHHPNEKFDSLLTSDKDYYILAHILRVADAFDGLTSSRRYKIKGRTFTRFDGRKIKVYSREEAFEVLRADPHYDQSVVDALERVINKGEHYIFNIKDLFDMSQIRFVWHGIEHLIRKTILPRADVPKEALKPDEWFVERAPILWLICDEKRKFKNVSEFIYFLKDEISSLASEKDLINDLFEAVATIQMEKVEYVGSIYEILFRAINIDREMGTDTFSLVIKLFHFYREDTAKIGKIIDDLLLDPQKDEDAFFLWLGSRLYGESTESVQTYSEGAFIAGVETLMQELELSWA